MPEKPIDPLNELKSEIMSMCQVADELAGQLEETNPDASIRWTRFANAMSAAHRLVCNMETDPAPIHPLAFRKAVENARGILAGKE
jgi:hypothetical protein